MHASTLFKFLANTKQIQPLECCQLVLPSPQPDLYPRRILVPQWKVPEHQRSFLVQWAMLRVKLWDQHRFLHPEFNRQSSKQHLRGAIFSVRGHYSPQQKYLPGILTRFECQSDSHRQKHFALETDLHHR